MKPTNILLTILAAVHGQQAASASEQQHWTSPATETAPTPHYSHTYTVSASYGPVAMPVGGDCEGYEGQWNCLTTSWQRCASGRWSVVMPVAEGTMCQPVGRSYDFQLVSTDASPLATTAATTITPQTAATPSVQPGGGSSSSSSSSGGGGAYASSATTTSGGGMRGTNNGFIGGTAAAGTGLAMAQRHNGGVSVVLVGGVGMMAVVFARLLI